MDIKGVIPMMEIAPDPEILKAVQELCKALDGGGYNAKPAPTMSSNDVACMSDEEFTRMFDMPAPIEVGQVWLDGKTEYTVLGKAKRPGLWMVSYENRDGVLRTSDWSEEGILSYGKLVGRRPVVDGVALVPGHVAVLSNGEARIDECPPDDRSDKYTYSVSYHGDWPGMKSGPYYIDPPAGTPRSDEVSKAVEAVDQALKSFVGSIKTFSKSPEPDRSKFPHQCPRCGKPAYIGFASTECSAGCA